MKTAILIVATLVAAASSATASAQTFGVYVGPAYDDYYDDDGPPAYRRLLNFCGQDGWFIFLREEAGVPVRQEERR